LKRSVKVLDAAAEEAAEAAAWYERQREGLGFEFQEAIEAALDLLEDEIVPLTPVPGIAGKRDAKRLILKRFPYTVIVREHGSVLAVVAFAHHSRRPGYWRDRLST
jgi:L-amino acid N-acyltransferase YncA